VNRPAKDLAPHLQLQLKHADAGWRVLSAWFDDAKFRAAWQPNEDLFCYDTQKVIARICAARGATLTRDDLILHLERQGKLKLWEHGAEEVLDDLLSAQVELQPWTAVDRLRELAGQRLLAQRLSDLRLELDRGESLAKTRQAIANALRDADFAGGTKARTVRESIEVAYRHATDPNRKRGARTISKRLDEATGGIEDGVVWLLAASTSWGKSSFQVALANRALRDGLRPLIVSCEDPERLFGSRLMLVRKQMNALRLRRGALLPDEHRGAVAALQEAEDVPWLLPAVGRSVEQIASDIRSLVASDNISFVMVDYVQAIHTAEKQQDRRNEIAYIGRLLTNAIKESGIGGILFSQLTEDASTGKLRARDCEDLHNAAEVLLFGTHEREAKGAMRADAAPDTKRLFIDKVKEGPAKFAIELAWNRHAACFVSDYDVEDQQRELGFNKDPAVDSSYDDFDNEHAN
jgi:replicative DNA helicase